MNFYGKEPQEQAIQTLIHDTNQALSELGFYIDKMYEHEKASFKKLKEAKLETSSNGFIAIEYLKSRKENMRKALDVYFEKAKNDFK